MNKSWLVIVLSIFITVLIWTGFQIFSCVGGYDNSLFGVSASFCGYDTGEKLKNTRVTPIPSKLSIENISSITEADRLVLVKDKSDLEK